MKTKREQLEELRAAAHVLVADRPYDEMAADEQTTLAKMLNDGAKLKTAIEAESDTSKKFEEITTFLGNLSGADAKDLIDEELKKHVETRNGPIAVPDGRKTLGELFIESTEYKGLLDRFPGGRLPATPGFKIGQSQSWMSPYDAKALLTGASATSAGAAVRNDMYAPITNLVPGRRLTVRDLLTQATTESDVVEFVRITAQTNAAVGVAEATTTADGTKPESSMALAVVTAPVVTIAHWLPATKRALSDAGQLRSLIDDFLLQGLAETEETALLNGAGAPSVTGILQTANILTVGSAGTDLDAIVDAIRTIDVTGGRTATAMVIHPNDWYGTGFMLAKDSTGRYMIGDPRASVTEQQALWGLRVVVTPAMTENTALVGEFRFGVIWDRERPTITMTDSHASFFIQNLIAILAEERLAFGVLDPEAFCTVTAI